MNKLVIANKGRHDVGKSSSIKKLYEKLKRLYPTNVTWWLKLLRGESVVLCTVTGKVKILSSFVKK